ncbi:MAG: hypothetical protein ABI528_06905 [bacterium]
MKTNFRKILFSILILLTTLFITNSISKNKDSINFHKIIEIPFYNSINKNDTLFKIMFGPNGFSKDYFLINPKNITMLSGQFPGLLKISDNKFIFNNNFQGLRIIDFNGQITRKIDYENKYFVDSKNSLVDKDNNLFLSLLNPNDEKDILGYMVAGDQSFVKILSKDSILKVKQNQELNYLNINKDLNILNSKFSISPSESDLSIFKKDDGRFLSVKSLIIYDNNIKLSEIEISKKFDDKIIFTKLYYVDSLLNVFVIGFKSNQFEKMNSDSNTKDSTIKIFNPVFFIWKFELSK